MSQSQMDLKTGKVVCRQHVYSNKCTNGNRKTYRHSVLLVWCTTSCWQQSQLEPVSPGDYKNIQTCHKQFNV